MSFIITVMYILLTLIIMFYNQNNSNKIYANLYRHQPPITMPTFTILTPAYDKTLKRTFWCSASKHSTVKKKTPTPVNHIEYQGHQKSLQEMCTIPF